MRVVVINHVTLDGVMQSPGRADEDTRGGFTHGGWAVARSDDTLVQVTGAAMGAEPAYLFGRRSYEELLASWNRQGGPFKDALNATPKYVVSRDPQTVLAWDNSTLLAGDAVETVAELKGRPGGNLVVMGSGELVRALLPHGLVDELVLMIHPVVLGDGRRLFGPAEQPLDWELASATTSPTGVVAATYRPPAS